MKKIRTLSTLFGVATLLSACSQTPEVGAPQAHLLEVPPEAIQKTALNANTTVFGPAEMDSTRTNRAGTALALPDGNTLVFGQFVNRNTGNTQGFVQRLSTDQKPLPYGYASSSSGISPFSSTLLTHVASTLDTTSATPKPVVVGQYQHPGEPYQSAAVVRFNNTTTGELDSTFGVGGAKVLDFGHATANQTVLNDVLVDRDGKIVVVGTFAPKIGVCCELVAFAARLNPNGSLDATFGGKGTGYATIFGAQGQEGLKISRDVEYGGYVVLSNQNGNARLFRLDRNGLTAPSLSNINPNLTFDFGGMDKATDLTAVGAEYLLAGTSTTSSGTKLALLKLDVNFKPIAFNGSQTALTLDTGTQGQEQNALITPMPGGRILLSGYSSNPAGNELYNVLLRPDGSLESQFAGGIQVLKTNQTGSTVQDVAVHNQVVQQGWLWWTTLNVNTRIVLTGSHKNPSAPAGELPVVNSSTGGYPLN